MEKHHYCDKIKTLLLTSKEFYPRHIAHQFHNPVADFIGLFAMAFYRSINNLPNTFRYSCASLLLANGVPLKQIQDWLGHSDFAITANIYAHLDFSAKHATAGAMSWIGETTGKKRGYRQVLGKHLTPQQASCAKTTMGLKYIKPANSQVYWHC